MPRNVRNFWIEASIDGAVKKIAGGPKSANGGFTLTIYQRDQGEVVKALEITGRCKMDGTLVCEVLPCFKATARVHSIDGALADVDSMTVETRR